MTQPSSRPILVVGGAGYVGSHMVKHLVRQGHRVLVVDNLSTGFSDAVHVAGGELIELDLSDADGLDSIFSQQTIGAVMHFALFIEVGESVKDPAKYYQNNLAATLNLLQAMVRFEVKQVVFSSTAAVYGEPAYLPIDEAHPKAPINPYGQSKWMVEQILQDFENAYGLRSVCLRYFNAAGADPEGELGERHQPETHLIPLVLQAVAGRRSDITVFGRDYDTPDGTCIRDYIHVVDLVKAHGLALGYLNGGGASTALNLGTGQGHSVQEVIDAARSVTGCDIPVRDAPRRAGDPPRLVADASLAKAVLGWTPQYSDLETMIQHAWAWEQKWPWGPKGSK